LGLNIIKIKEEGKEMDKVIEEAMAIISLYPDVFPHLIRQGYKLVRDIKKGGLVLQDGVVITFSRSLKKGKYSTNATTIKKTNDFIIHQIASDQVQKGATKKVLDGFVEYCKYKGAGNILLSVRAENERACKFYERYGFTWDSDIHWKSDGGNVGTIRGVIYRLQLKNINSDKFFKLFKN
tara:strand:- start:54 stop:593 length:540 start_codon:yes stop_codon:yes gene_type:complete